MKIGRSLEDLAAEVLRQKDAKRDYVVAAKHVAMALRQAPGDESPVPILQLGDDLPLLGGIQSIAHGQLSEFTKIPKGYYDRMLAEDPHLLRDNVNAWLGRSPTKRTVRTLDETTRAFLSDGFRPLDNYDFMEAALPRLIELGVEVISCDITPSRLYLKVVDKRIERDIPTGKRLGDGSHVFFDTASPVLVLSNSEVGLGALSLQTGVLTKMCTNLCVVSERSTRKYHLGSKVDIGEEIFKLLSDDTRRKTDEALWGQIRDLVGAAFDQAQFDAVCEIVGAASKDPIEDPVKVVEITAKKYTLTEGEKGSILQHLVKGGDLTRYGLHAAITRTAEDLENYDRASQFEQLGGKIIELQPTEWREFAKAA